MIHHFEIFEAVCRLREKYCNIITQSESRSAQSLLRENIGMRREMFYDKTDCVLAIMFIAKALNVNDC
jgi:hypothetical protein